MLVDGHQAISVGLVLLWMVPLKAHPPAGDADATVWATSPRCRRRRVVGSGAVDCGFWAAVVNVFQKG